MVKRLPGDSVSSHGSCTAVKSGEPCTISLSNVSRTWTSFDINYQGDGVKTEVDLEVEGSINGRGALLPLKFSATRGARVGSLAF